MDNKEKTLKEIIVGIVNEPDVTVDSLNNDAILIGEDGLFVDSIDVLELVMQIEKQFGIKVTDNQIRSQFKSIKTVLDFIDANAK